MFDDLRELGLPLGPLAQHSTVFAKAPGRGKIHLLWDCVPGLDPLSMPLASIPDTKMCSRCGDRLVNSDRVYLAAVTSYLDMATGARRILEDLADGDVVDPRLRWRMALNLWAVSHPDPDPAACGGHNGPLAAWAQTAVAPLLRQALAAWHTQPDARLVDDWPVRATAAHEVLGDPNASIPRDTWQKQDYPALTPTPGAWSALRPPGQAGIPQAVRDAVRRGFLAGLADAEVLATANRAGLDILDGEAGPESRNQVPGDAAVPDGNFGSVDELLVAVWRTAAASDIEKWARFLLVRAQESLQQHSEEPLVAYSWRIRDHRLTTESDAAVTAFAVGRLPGGAMLTFSPQGVAQRCHYDSSARLERSFYWGPVAPDDTLATYAAAVRMLKHTDSDAAGAVALARASLV